MNTFLVLYVVSFLVSMGVACPAAFWMIKFVRTQIVNVFAVYKQANDDGDQKWFYDQPAIGFEGLTVEWRWLVLPRFYWNQEKDTTPMWKKFVDAWCKSTRRWWSLMRLWDALKAVFVDSRVPITYVTQKQLIPTNGNEGLVFDGEHILVRRSPWSSIIGGLTIVMIVVVAIAFIFLIVQSTISNVTAIPTPATSRIISTAFVVPTRTIAQATASAQPTAIALPRSATPTPVVSNTPLPLVTLPGQTNMAPNPTSTRAPAAPPSTNNSLIGGLLLILFGLVPGGVIGYFIGFNNGRKEQQ